MSSKGDTRSACVLRHLEVPVLVIVPLVLGLCAWFDVDQAAVLTFAVALIAIGLFFAGYESSRPALRQVMPTVVLGALAAAGRILFAAIPDAKPVTAICIVAGTTFGRRSGFMVGALAALVSNFFFGQGAWTPWQMYAWGLVGYLAAVLADRGAFKVMPPHNDGRPWRSRFSSSIIYIYGFLSALFYGFVLNTWTLVGFVDPLTWESALLTYGAGLPLDLVHAVATVVFLLLIYAPWRTKLERIKTKYALVLD